MMIKSVAVAMILALSSTVYAERGATALRRNQEHDDTIANRALTDSRGEGKGKGKKGKGDDDDMWEITITNLTFRQPMGPFFAMVHSDMAEPLFTLGEESSEPLAILAENGSPAELVANIVAGKTKGVAFSGAFLGDQMPPLGPGVRRSFKVPVRGRARYISIASMLINTNDCFVALNGVPIREGVTMAVGYDSGSEVNNEQCNSIPGPACANINTENERSGDGEGYVHVHRGFHGVGDLAESRYDWRNPVARIEIRRA